MSNTSKMDTSAVFEMFETIKELIIKQPQKQTEKQAESVKVDIDTSVLDEATARIENAVDSEFSVIQATRESKPNTAIENGGNLPVPYINYGEADGLKRFEEGIAMWCSLGLNVRTPEAILKGNIGNLS